MRIHAQPLQIAGGSAAHVLNTCTIKTKRTKLYFRAHRWPSNRNQRILIVWAHGFDARVLWILNWLRGLLNELIVASHSDELVRFGS